METVGIYKVAKDAVIPEKSTRLAGCYDVCACFHAPVVSVYGGGKIPVYGYGEENDNNENSCIRILPNDMVLIPTGLIFCIPSKFHIEFLSRSGSVWKRRLKVANKPAIIDADYTKEAFVLIENCSEEVQIIKQGDRVAQCKIVKSNIIHFKEYDDQTFNRFVDVVEQLSDRDGGLGSTGV